MRILRRLSKGEQQPIEAGERAALSKLALLSETDIFRGLSDEDMQDIDRMTSMSTCRRGNVFYAPGETGEALFVIKQGRVSLYRLNPDGKKLVLGTAGPGTVFGEMSLVGQGMHDTFAEAAEECTVCVMSRQDVERLLLSKPLVALHFLEILAGRLSDIETRLESVAFKNVPGRLATELLRLAGDGGRVEGVSHQELADTVGSYRETVTRILNEFRRDELIELDRMRIAIVDPARLQQIAEE